jgi:hypothetical protein
VEIIEYSTIHKHTVVVTYRLEKLKEYKKKPLTPGINFLKKVNKFSFQYISSGNIQGMLRSPKKLFGKHS